MAAPSQVLAPRSTARFRPPRFGLGGSHLGDADDAKAIATVDAAYQAGIRFFDTSPAYGDSERRLGTALQRRPRGEFLVSTKVTGNDPEESVRASGERLGLAVDLVFAHNQAAYPVLDGMRRDGVSLPQAALAFPSRHSAVTSVLIAAASPAEIRADAALVRQPVPERLWKDPELLRLLSSN